MEQFTSLFKRSNTGLYKRHDKTEEDSFALVLLLETFRDVSF